VLSSEQAHVQSSQKNVGLVRVKSDGGGSDWKRLESREGRKLMQKR